MNANVTQINIPLDKRVICISDIHGSLDLLKKLLRKINYVDNDILILLGDIYTKGKQPHETLQFIIELSKKPNVYVLRGNCDWEEDYLTVTEKTWLNELPHIIETQDYIFVHGGLTSKDLDAQDAVSCMKNDGFMEKDLSFDKYIITSHWPTVNYTHKIPCFNPIVNRDKRIIAIDGGNVLKDAGQLNAFIISSGEYSYSYADDLPEIKIAKTQIPIGGHLNITWFDRFIEFIEDIDDEFNLYKHIQSGKTIVLPKNGVWTDNNGNLCECDNGTDYYLPVDIGDVVSLVKQYGNKILVKKNGIVGWINNNVCMNIISTKSIIKASQ
jgi:predicted phosphodiesterase